MHYWNFSQFYLEKRYFGQQNGAVIKMAFYYCGCSSLMKIASPAFARPAGSSDVKFLFQKGVWNEIMFWKDTFVKDTLCQGHFVSRTLCVKDTLCQGHFS